MENTKKKTFWQMVKYLLVSIGVTLIQLLLVNVLYVVMKGITTPLPEILGDIFSEQVMGQGHSNWGYLLPFLLSNLIANAVGYFVNKSKTFKSDAPTWHFVVYLAILLVLILFSTWIQGVIVNALNNLQVQFLAKLAPTIAAMAVGGFQLICLFPLQKFVLLREKK